MNTQYKEDGRLHVSHESNYRNYNTHSHIFDNTIINSSTRKNKHNIDFNDGTCYFLLSSSPTTSKYASIITTSAVHSSLPLTQGNEIFTTATITNNDNLNNDFERKIEKPYTVCSISESDLTVNSSSGDVLKLTYSLPPHLYQTLAGTIYTKVHIPNETSLSSGIVSETSSELSDEHDIHDIRRDDRHITNIITVSPKTVNPEKSLQNPVFVGDNKEFRSQSTQTDHRISCPCSCVNKSQIENIAHLTDQMINAELNTSSESNRRDSGFSSLSGTSSRTPISPQSNEVSLNSIEEEESISRICKPKVYKTVDNNNNFDPIDIIVSSPKRHSLKHQYNEAKERYLQSIKQTKFDPKKELYLLELKKRLLKTRLESIEAHNKTREWEPIFPTRLIPRSALKRNFIQSKANTLEFKRPVKQIAMNTKALAKVINQTKQCLAIIQEKRKTPQINVQKSFQIHRKIKLKSYSVQYGNGAENTKKCRSTLQNQTKSNLQNRDADVKDETNCFPCSRKPKKDLRGNVELARKTATGQIHLDMDSDIHESSMSGDIRNILELLQCNSVDVNEKDGTGNVPMHHALKNEHYRTAILLMEAGTNLKDYTQQKIGEYKKVKEIIQRNNIQILN